MKKKVFCKLKVKMLSALAKGQLEEAGEIRKELYQGILRRKQNGKKLYMCNFH